MGHQYSSSNPIERGNTRAMNYCRHYPSNFRKADELANTRKDLSIKRAKTPTHPEFATVLWQQGYKSARNVSSSKAVHSFIILLLALARPFWWEKTFILVTSLLLFPLITYHKKFSTKIRKFFSSRDFRAPDFLPLRLSPKYCDDTKYIFFPCNWIAKEGFIRPHTRT